MAAPALPADVRRLREQLLKDQAPSARVRTQVFDSGAFAGRYGRPYSSRRLPLSTLEEMRGDAILRFAQITALVSVFTAKWKVECSNARKAAYVDAALRRIIGRLIIQHFESWSFGFAALVKEFGLMRPGWQYIDRNAEGGPKAAPVWDEGGLPALVWEPFVSLRPQSVAPVWTAGGEFNGIAIDMLGQTRGGYSFPTIPLAPDDMVDHSTTLSPSLTGPDSVRRKISVENSLWITNERDGSWGSAWGFPRLARAHKYWFSSELVLGILNRSVERKGDPTVVVSYPMGSSNVDGIETPNQQIAFQIGESARSGSVLAVPSEVWGEDMATSNQAAKWRIDYLKAEENFDSLLKVMAYMDTMKFRAMFISELSLTEGASGSSSRNVASVTGQRSAEAQFFAQAELDEVINRYMIPQLADANFPELKDEPARKITQSFGDDEAQLAADLLRSFANADPTRLPLKLPALLERFQIDSLEGDELAKWERNLVKQSEMAKPPAEEAKPNGAAGVTDTGFYYDAPERIQLAEDEAMLASLPKTRHYSDRAVLAQTRLVRKLWHNLLSEQYEDFAAYVAKIDPNELELADNPKEMYAKTAATVVAGWRFAGKTANVVKSTALALTKILARAGAVELSSSRIKTDSWDPEAKAISEWIKDNTGALIRSVDETTKAQLRTFLAAELADGKNADQIASGIRSHFSLFPDWRADLIARTESSRAYVAGTLFSAQAAGATQLQAIDGENFDERCKRRNGKVFSVEDAWVEAADVHPNDLLAFRILPPGANLSVSRASRSEMGEVVARFDQDERVIHLVDGIDPEAEGHYLRQAVEWLVSSAPAGE